MMTQMVLTTIGSAGLWTFLGVLVSNYTVRKNAKFNEQEVIKQAVISIQHDRFFQECKYFIKKGNIGTEDLENVNRLFDAYTALGGNGAGKALYEKVKQLPIVDDEKE